MFGGGRGMGVQVFDGCVSLPVCGFSGVLFFPCCELHTYSHALAAVLSVYTLWEKKWREMNESQDKYLIPLRPKEKPNTYSGGLECLLSQLLYSPHPSMQNCNLHTDHGALAHSAARVPVNLLPFNTSFS